MWMGGLVRLSKVMSSIKADPPPRSFFGSMPTQLGELLMDKQSPQGYERGTDDLSRSWAPHIDNAICLHSMAPNQKVASSLANLTLNWESNNSRIALTNQNHC